MKSVTFVSASARTSGSATGQGTAGQAAADADADPAGGWHPRTWLGAPRGVYPGPDGGRDVLVVADTGNHRVLIWHEAPERDEQPCDVVLVQPGPFSDGPALAVADTANNRILLWDRLADRPVGQAATAVLGQPEFGPNGENHWTGVTRDSLRWPYGLSLAGRRLAIADSGNNRVVIWGRQ